MLATLPPAVIEAESQRIALLAKIKTALLAIFDPAGQGGGSGVVISADGFALSNFHVVQPCGTAMKCGMPDGRVYDCVVVGLDPTGDVALVQVLGRDDFPHAELGDSDLLRPGDPVFALGNPFLLAADFQPTVTAGIVSGVHRYQFPEGTLLEYADCIQTDASINPGNSGGPLFDGRGRLVGINGRCSFDKRGRVSVNVGYAVSINQIKNFLGDLRSGRIVDHATLGARVAADEQGQVVVSDVLEQSDAYRRGLRVDDELVRFAGRRVATPNGFKNVLGILPKGWRVPLSYRREGKLYDVLVRLSGVHGKEQLLERVMGHAPQPMPLPPPGEEPRGKKRGEPKPLIPRPDLPLPVQLSRAKPPMPEIVKRHFEEKHGYANYYYNRREQERVLGSWKMPAEIKPLAGPWTVSGRLEHGGGFRLRLTDSEAMLEAPIGDCRWTAAGPWAGSLLPAGSNGLLPALCLWRRLVLQGPAGFSPLDYRGTAPLPGRETLADVVVGSYRGVEGWFFFDPAGGQLLALEMYADEHADPCEIYFSQYRDADGRTLPGRMEVRAGDTWFGTFLLDEFDFREAPKT
ncbi:MAG: trypsin-like peptidase domain-containing protein [Thermoguttaceae bacterium]